MMNSVMTAMYTRETDIVCADICLIEAGEKEEHTLLCLLSTFVQHQLLNERHYANNKINENSPHAITDCLSTPLSAHCNSLRWERELWRLYD